LAVTYAGLLAWLAVWAVRCAWLAAGMRRRAKELEARDPDLMRLYRRM
jgi:hypothetical protein